MKRTLAVLLVAVAVLGSVTVLRSSSKADSTSNQDSHEKWEYLIVAGPSSANFATSGNPKLRKVEGKFGREAVAMEGHFDSLGAEGWQLVSVAGEPRDPVFYFKRLK
jgi:hypothetical protein